MLEGCWTLVALLRPVFLSGTSGQARQLAGGALLGGARPGKSVDYAGCSKRTTCCHWPRRSSRSKSTLKAGEAGTPDRDLPCATGRQPTARGAGKP
ncbi:hypothetical protein F4780DRAFT_747567 [Xylariomycetidae sp. FL0641]|nr:hypothetical protein F4780DRAFT_747567 [Xylariomycetidae sp. FL0641]